VHVWLYLTAKVRHEQEKKMFKSTDNRPSLFWLFCYGCYALMHPCSAKPAEVCFSPFSHFVCRHVPGRNSKFSRGDHLLETTLIHSLFLQNIELNNFLKSTFISNLSINYRLLITKFLFNLLSPPRYISNIVYLQQFSTSLNASHNVVQTY